MPPESHRISPAWCNGLFLTALFACFTCQGQIDWPLLAYNPVTSATFPSPTFIVHAGDGSGRLFVGQQSGLIQILRGSNVLLTPFLDVTSRVLMGPERGLLGCAFSPGFATNGQVYLNYTRKPDGATVVSRFTGAPGSDVVETNTEQVMLVVPQPFENHNGGQLAFGPDGYLYIGLGDGGSSGDPMNQAQNKQSLLGKLLRIDVQAGAPAYSVPASNPFVGNTNYAPEIWALGLRNPWRFSFDRLTGDLYIADVGQAQSEEVNFQAAISNGGQNYGWNIFEGPLPYRLPPQGFDVSTVTFPVTAYPRGAGASVTGGFVYRAADEPRLQGIYFFGDFYSGRIWGLARQGTNWLRRELTRTQFGISTFGEAEDGKLFVADYIAGRIYVLGDTYEVWPPALTPSGGSFNTEQDVLVSSPTPGAALHFTINGADPTVADPVVPPHGNIHIGGNAVLKVRAYRADLQPSAIVAANFSFMTAPPVFSRNSGPITNGTVITITSATPNAGIFYTTNGSDPDTNSAQYSGPLALLGNTQLRAFAVKDRFSPSSIKTANYPLMPCATPYFTPPPGAVTEGAEVTIASDTPNATIRYTLDGSDPSPMSPTYTAPLVVNAGVMVRAQALRSDLSDSGVQSGYFGIVRFEQTVVTTIAGSTGAGLSNGPALWARFSAPIGLCIDQSNNLFVADSGNHIIRKISAAGQVTTFAGTGEQGFRLGPATNAQFNTPRGVCVDQIGNVYVADGNFCDRILKIGTNGNVTEVANLRPCYVLPGLGYLEIDLAGNLYAGNWATVTKVSPAGLLSTLAGSGLSGIDGWEGGVGVGLDPLTNVYAATEAKIWKIPSGQPASLFAGSSRGFTDGFRTVALFDGPGDTAIDSNTNIFITDNNRIRMIRPNGNVSTYAGSGGAGFANGPAAVAQFNSTAGLCIDSQGNVYVADRGNNCIRKISVDTDSDLIPDLREGGSTPYVVGIDDRAVDSDGDGISNSDENLAGTSPVDHHSRFAVASTTVQTSGVIHIEWFSVSERSYSIESSLNLHEWSEATNVWGTGAKMSFSEAWSPASGMRIYRIVVRSY